VREIAPKIVTADLPPVGIAGLVTDALGRPGHDALDALWRQFDQRFVVGDFLAVAVEVDRPLDLVRQVGVPRLPSLAGGVLATRHPEAVVLAVAGPADVLRPKLRDLEASEPDLAAEADNQVVTVAFCGVPEALVLVGRQPAAVRVVTRVALDFHVAIAVPSVTVNASGQP